MSSRDRDWLELAGISMSEVANYLGGISRQAVAKQIASKKPYLTEERLNAICGALLRLNTPRSKKAAVELLESADAEGIELEVEGIASPLHTLKMMTPLGSKEFWIFSDRPRELQRGSFLEFMATSIFADPNQLVVYFVPREAVGKSLKRAITQADTDILRPKNQRFLANIFVIETNLVEVLPHVMIRAPQSLCVENESATLQSGWVMIGSSAAEEQMVELPAEYTQKLIELIRDCDIGMSLGIAGFFPEKLKVRTASGIYFKELWRKLPN